MVSNIVFFYRVVKRSSYQLNSIILAAVFIGFVGTLLFVIRLDSNMRHSSSIALCTVNDNYLLYQNDN